MKIKGAIFDVDGTLLDSMSVWERRGELFLKKLGIDVSAESDYDEKGIRMYNSPEFVKNKFSVNLSNREIWNGMLKIVDDFYKTDVSVKPGTIEFLEELKLNGVKMCVATATDRSMVEPALIKCGIRDYFSEIFTCGELKTSKNFPDIFEKSLSFLGTEKTDTVIFEDAIYAVKTAKQAGFFVTGIYDKVELEQEEMRRICDVFVYNLKDSLKNIL